MHPVRPKRNNKSNAGKTVRSNGVQGKVDLHLHSNFSDGTFPPEEVVAQSHKKGFAVISIVDHDCIDGIDRALQAGLKCGIKVIPGVEITAEKEGIEIHILGYFIDYNNKKLKSALSGAGESREKRIYDMIEKLKTVGVDISPESVFKLSKEGSIGRPHLAKALVNEGFVTSQDEAFRKYLGDKAPCYVSKFNLTPEEAIKIIRDAKGVPVYAHPKVVGRDDFIPGFIKAGLRGLEVYHTDHNKADTKYYREMARTNNLIVTGGSDFHGAVKKDVFIGSIDIPHKIVEELEKEAERIRKAGD